jgi:hypothetical protein
VSQLLNSLFLLAEFKEMQPFLKLAAAVCFFLSFYRDLKLFNNGSEQFNFSSREIVYER